MPTSDAAYALAFALAKAAKKGDGTAVWNLLSKMVSAASKPAKAVERPSQKGAWEMQGEGFLDWLLGKPAVGGNEAEQQQVKELEHQVLHGWKEDAKGKPTPPQGRFPEPEKPTGKPGGSDKPTGKPAEAGKPRANEEDAQEAIGLSPTEQKVYDGELIHLFSSCVYSIKYDRLGGLGENRVYITFRPSGDQYTYYDVPWAVIMDEIQTDSPGRGIWRWFREGEPPYKSLYNGRKTGNISLGKAEKKRNVLHILKMGKRKP